MLYEVILFSVTANKHIKACELALFNTMSVVFLNGTCVKVLDINYAHTYLKFQLA